MPAAPSAVAGDHAACRFSDSPAAFEACSRLIESGTLQADVYEVRGSILSLYKKDFAGALADFTAAVRVGPNHKLAYYERGLLYRGSSDYDRAIADFSEAIRINPSYQKAYQDRGLSYE